MPVLNDRLKSAQRTARSHGMVFMPWVRHPTPHPSRPAGTPSPLGEGGEFVGAVSARINPCPSTFSCTGAPGSSQYDRVQPFFSSLPGVERTTYLQSKLPLRSATIHGSAVANHTYRATAPRTIYATASQSCIALKVPKSTVGQRRPLRSGIRRRRLAQTFQFRSARLGRK